jgi:hypothetical protein
MFLILSAAFVHSIDFNTLPQNVSYPGKNCQIQAIAGENLKYVTLLPADDVIRRI